MNLPKEIQTQPDLFGKRDSLVVSDMRKDCSVPYKCLAKLRRLCDAYHNSSLGAFMFKAILFSASTAFALTAGVTSANLSLIHI